MLAMVQRRKKGSAFSAHEIESFLGKLAETGNITLAAEFIGRPPKSLRARRRGDPDFAARCDLALARFRTSASAKGGPVPRGKRQAWRTQGGEWVVTRGGPGRSPQLRRARPGQLTRHGFALFLRTLAATANIHLSARTVGVSSTTIDYHRKRDLAFDQQVEEALKQGVERLEDELLASALRGLSEMGGEPGDEPDAATGQAFADPAFPQPPPLPPMRADEAFALLCKQRELLSRPRKWSAERDRQARELATRRLEKVMKGLGLLADRDEAPPAAHPGPAHKPAGESGPRPPVKRP